VASNFVDVFIMLSSFFHHPAPGLHNHPLSAL